MSDIDTQLRIFLLVLACLFIAIGGLGIWFMCNGREIIGMILGGASIYIEGQLFIYYAQTLE